MATKYTYERVLVLTESEREFVSRLLSYAHGSLTNNGIPWVARALVEGVQKKVAAARRRKVTTTTVVEVVRP